MGGKMKSARMLAFILFCAVIGISGLNAEAGWKSLKKKVEKKVEEKDKKKKDTVKETKKEENAVYVENFGTGLRKTGGTFAGFEIAKLKDSDNLKFECLSGKCNTLTVHGRTSRGVWATLYQGKLKEVNVGTVIAGKRSNYTHLIISVNGAHESYTKIAAKMGIVTVAGKEDIPADTGKNDIPQKEEKNESSGSAVLDLDKSISVQVSNTEFADLSFTVKNSKQKRYYITVSNPDGVDCASDGYTVEKFDHLYYDRGYSKGVTGYDYGWKGNYPQAYFYSSYDLKSGTYYIRVKNVCSRYKNNKVKLSLKLSENSTPPGVK